MRKRWIDRTIEVYKNETSFTDNGFPYCHKCRHYEWLVESYICMKVAREFNIVMKIHGGNSCNKWEAVE